MQHVRRFGQVIDQRKIATGTYNPAGDKAEAVAAAELRRETRSPLSDLFPVLRIERAYFNQITVPAGLTIGTGQVGFFGMRSIRIPNDIATDAMLFGYQAEMVSSDGAGAGIAGQISAAGGAGTALAWGDATGTGACILVGYDLGITVGSWISRDPPDVAGIDANTASAPNANTKLNPTGGGASYPAVLRFPPGSWNATTPGLLRTSLITLPAQRPLRYGQSLDVALVVSKTTVNNLANSRVICGRGEVSLFLIETESFARQ